MHKTVTFIISTLKKSLLFPPCSLWGPPTAESPIHPESHSSSAYTATSGMPNRAYYFLCSNVPEKTCRSVFQKTAEFLRARLIAQMAGIRQDPSLQRVGIGSILKHADIVVGFQHHQVRPCTACRTGVGHKAEVSRHRKSPSVLRHDSIPDTFSTVMGSSKAFYVHAGAFNTAARKGNRLGHSI